MEGVEDEKITPFLEMLFIQLNSTGKALQLRCLSLVVRRRSSEVVMIMEETSIYY